MGCNPSFQKDPQLREKVNLIRSYYRSILTSKHELNLLKIKQIHYNTNSDYLELKTTASISRLTTANIQDIHQIKSSFSRPIKHKRFASASLNSQDLDIGDFPESSDILENLLHTEIQKDIRKTEVLKNRLKELQELLKNKRKNYEERLKNPNWNLDSSKKSMHRKNYSERFGESTCYTTGNFENSELIDKSPKKSLNEVKCAVKISPEVMELKSKIGMRDEMKGIIEMNLKRYEKKMNKIQELERRLEREKVDGLDSMKYTENELRILKCRIIVLEKEIDNDVKEQGFLINVLEIGKKFHDFQSRRIIGADSIIVV